MSGAGGISEGWGVGLTLEGTLVVAERPFPEVPAQQLLQGEGTAQTMNAHPSSGAGTGPASWASRSCCRSTSLSTLTQPRALNVTRAHPWAWLAPSEPPPGRDTGPRTRRRAQDGPVLLSAACITPKDMAFTGGHGAARTSLSAQLLLSDAGTDQKPGRERASSLAGTWHLPPQLDKSQGAPQQGPGTGWPGLQGAPPSRGWAKDTDRRHPPPPPPTADPEASYRTNLPAKLGNHRTESPELAEPTPGSEQTLGERGWTQGGGGPAHLSVTPAHSAAQVRCEHDGQATFFREVLQPVLHARLPPR